MKTLAEKMRDAPPEIQAAYAKASKNRSNDAALIEIIVDAIGDALVPRLKNMNERIAALETRPAVKYCGVWREGKAYGAGNMVTDAGSMWHADRATMERPGTGTDWVLAVKRGRDGKDGRR